MPEAPSEWLHKSPPWQVAGQVSFSPTPWCLRGHAILFSWSAQVCLYLLLAFCAVHFQLKHSAAWNTGKTPPVFNFPAKCKTEVCWSFAGLCLLKWVSFKEYHWYGVWMGHVITKICRSLLIAETATQACLFSHVPIEVVWTKPKWSL